ncbi:TorF family putative porin [Paremcibacter congregatus]|uniref:TorF family putative porin n=1 Tax=Paremcibacter congregatus TaxID=2043170 RepID=UPI0013FDCF09|nr:TorF family putative porin [Paremcibacter congregatus]
MTLRRKAIFTTLLLAGTLGATLPAQAELGGGFSANITMTNDYRFRGVSLNDEGFSLQGGLDWAHESGFYVGTWATNISDFNGASMETDFYGGYAGEKDGITYDIGGLLYHYPGGSNTDYFEVYGSVGMDLGFVSASVGSNYAFSSDNTGNDDNLYLYTKGDVVIPDTPFTVNLHLGYEDGAFANKKWDWSVGTSVAYQGLDFGITYIDTNLAGDNADATVLFSVGASF